MKTSSSAVKYVILRGLLNFWRQNRHDPSKLLEPNLAERHNITSQVTCYGHCCENLKLRTSKYVSKYIKIFIVTLLQVVIKLFNLWSEFLKQYQK